MFEFFSGLALGIVLGAVGVWLWASTTVIEESDAERAAHMRD